MSAVLFALLALAVLLLVCGPVLHASLAGLIVLGA